MEFNLLIYLYSFLLQQIIDMIADVDKDGSGAIDFEEFALMMTGKIGERDAKEELTKAFHIIDRDNNVIMIKLAYYM